jgi:uncharacterized protein YxeA
MAQTVIFIISILLIVVVVCLTVLKHQEIDHEYELQKNEAKDSTELAAQLEKQAKEFEDYKKRVDALTLRAGFGK